MNQPKGWGRLALLMGKVRRFFQNVFRPGFVRKNLARRGGQCQRCGACCQLGVRCKHLSYDPAGQSLCDAYDKFRMANCRNFPVTQKDLAERDRILPDVPCGFHFPAEASDADGSAPSCRQGRS